MNLRLVFVSTRILIFMMLLVSSANANTPEQVFVHASPSIVVVDVIDAKGKLIGLGSGVVIGIGQVITNCHVAQKNQSIQVRQSGNTFKATLQFADRTRDLCQLSVPTLQAPSVTLGTTKNLAIGQRVYAIGAPQGLELTLSEGLISSLRNYEGSQYIQTSAAISSGSSGGGLFDEKGRLIGITTFYFSEGQNLNFALPVDWISELPMREKFTETGDGIDWLSRAVVLENEKNWQGLLDHSLLWIKSEPRNVSAWIILGGAYEGLKQYDKAIQAHLEALSIQPENANAWYGLGMVYGDSLKQYDEAIRSYREVLRIQPEFASAWSRLGIVYGSGLKQYNEAIRAFREALRIQPKDVTTLYNLGFAYYKNEQYDQAIQVYREVLHIEPESADAWYNLGATYYLQSQQETNRILVRDIYNILRKLNPAMADNYFKAFLSPDSSTKTSEPALTQEITSDMVGQGSISEALEKKDWRRVLRFTQQMTKSDPDDYVTWYTMGFAYGELKLYDQAGQAYREAVRIKPDFAEAWQALGKAYVKLKQYALADIAFRKYWQLRGK